MSNIFRCLIFCLFSFNAYAWGPEGQMVVASVAEKHLSSTAGVKIKSIIQNSSLADLATWADDARRLPEWNYTGSWHYIDVPVSRKGSLTADVPNDVREAIYFSVEKLSSDLQSGEKLVWLKFLIHFMGDIHQPMHVGNPDDRGGNLTTVSYKGKKFNLHALWDGAFIKEQNLGVKLYVEKLLAQSRPRDTLREIFNPDIVIEENLRHRDFLYSFSNSEIDKIYAKRALDLTEERLWTGGLRLAAVLNEIFK